MKRVPNRTGQREKQKPFKGSGPSATSKRPSHVATWKTIGLLLALGVGGNVFAHFATKRSTTPSPQTQAQQSGKSAPRTLAELLALPAEDLKNCDIALINLLCAEGLRGSEQLNVAETLKLLDGLSSHVERETTRHLYRYRDKPAEFNQCEPLFRMEMLATVLQQDLRVHYNPERATPVGVFEENDFFFANSEDVFIHGLIGDKRMGTCASMPVFYVAVGRRLGYPLKLVPTKNHLFVRWEDDRWRFNVDATGRGFHHFDDNHYRQWPYPISKEEEAKFGLLISMTTAEELAAFLNLRGACLMSMGRPDDAVAAHEQAARLAPQRREHQIILAHAQEERDGKRQPPRVLLPDGRLVSAESAERELTILRALEQNRQRLNAPWGMTGLTPEQQRMLPLDPNPLLKLRQGNP